MFSRQRKDSSGGPRLRRQAVMALGVGAMAAAMLAAPIGAGASVRHSKLTPLQQGMKFYKGKTITLIEPGSTGGPFDLYARALAPYLGAYLHATVNVEDITTGNTITGQDAMAAAKPDGLTIGMLNVLNDISLSVTHTAGLNFNPARLAFIAQAGQSTSVLVANPSSSFKTFSQVKSSGSPVSILTENSGTDNLILRVWMGVLGVKTNFVSGYIKLTDLVQGFLRGDAPVSLISLSNSGALIAAQKAVPLAVTVQPAPGTLYRSSLTHLPTLASLLAQYPAKSKLATSQYDAMLAMSKAGGTPLVTQTRVPNAEVVALRAAAKFTFKAGGFKAQMLKDGLNPTYNDPVTAKQAYITSLAKGSTIACFITASC